MAKVAFYRIGNSQIATNVFLRKIGMDVVHIHSPNKSTINKGVLYAPEFACFPFKVSLGLLMQAIDNGAQAYVMPGARSQVACQLSDFGTAQKYIMQKTGKKIDVILFDTIQPQIILKKFKKYNPRLTLKQVTAALLLGRQKLLMLEDVEEYYRRIYVAEKKRKAEIFKTRWEREIEKTDTMLELYKLGQKIRADFAQHKQPSGNLLRIAVIGDIYCVNENFVNNNIFERLCDLNVYVEKGIPTSSILGGSLELNPKEVFLSIEAEKYLKHNVAAFAKGTIKDAIRYTSEGYDGLIHIYPFNCMPEITVRNILPKLSQDYNIPILYLPIDEQTGDAGFATRLEAFVDLLRIRKNKSNQVVVESK